FHAALLLSLRVGQPTPARPSSKQRRASMASPTCRSSPTRPKDHTLAAKLAYGRRDPDQEATSSNVPSYQGKVNGCFLPNPISPTDMHGQSPRSTCFRRRRLRRRQHAPRYTRPTALSALLPPHAGPCDPLQQGIWL